MATGTHLPTSILQSGLKTEVETQPKRSIEASKKVSTDAINEVKDYFPASVLEFLCEKFLSKFSENWQQTIVSACLDTIYEVLNIFHNLS